MAGEATVRHAHRTFSSTGASLSEPEVARPLITPDETTRLGSNEAMIFTSGQPAIRATKIRYYTEPFFKRRAAIPPPPKSDRVEQSASEDNARNAMPASSISNRVAPPPENRAPDQSHPNPVPSQARINPRLARSLRF
jgi:type IV secretory pathway TraG/TraD family ATPase VirD4